MKNNLKRIIAAVLAAVMVLSLAACNGGGEPANNDGAASTNKYTNVATFDSDAFIASVPAELRGTTLTFLNWYNPDDRAAEKANIEAFESASGINVEVINTAYGKEYNDKLAGLVATGSAPDIIRMSEPQMAWMKYLQPITNSGYDFSDDAWSTDVKDLYSVGGIQYAANLSYTPFVLFQTMVYHTDTMEEFGFEDPWELYKKGEWTWQELEKMCSAWIKQGPDYYGVATGHYGMIAESAGLDFMKYDGSKWSANLYDADLLDIWRFTLEGRDNRYYVQGTNTTFDATKHKALFAYTDSTGLEASSVYNEKIKRRGVFGVAPMPKFEGKDYYAGVTELVGFGMPIGAKNPKAVPYFISWYGNLGKYDMDTYFYNEQSCEVFEALVSEPNRFLSMSESLFVFEANDGFIWSLFTHAASSQITGYIQTYEYLCQDALAKHNDVLANMNK